MAFGAASDRGPKWYGKLQPLRPSVNTENCAREAGKKKYLKALVFGTGVLGLMLVAGSYVLSENDVVHAVKRGTMPEGDQPESAMSIIESPLPGSSSRLIAANPGHVLSIPPDSGSVSRKVDARAVHEDKRKALLAYHEAVRCREYAQANRAVSVINEKMIPLIETEQQADGYRQRLEELDKVLKRSHDQCDGISLEQINTSFFELTLRAALDGDLGAQGCFVEFGDRDQFKNPARKVQYFANAPDFMRRGIEAAYWPIVQNAVTRLIAWWVDNQPQLMSLPEPNPKHVYRAVRLTYYRSDPGGTKMLEDIMENIEHRYHISPQEVDQADRWAQQEYAARFASTPPLEPFGRMKYCQ